MRRDLDVVMVFQSELALAWPVKPEPHFSLDSPLVDPGAEIFLHHRQDMLTPDGLLRDPDGLAGRAEYVIVIRVDR